MPLLSQSLAAAAAAAAAAAGWSRKLRPVSGEQSGIPHNRLFAMHHIPTW